MQHSMDVMGDHLLRHARGLGDLALFVLDALDFGVLLLDTDATTILYTNNAGRALVHLWRVDGDRAPEALVTVVRAFAGGDERRFSRAVPVVTPTARRVWVRCRRIAGEIPMVLMTASDHVLRDHALSKILHDRFGLNARECQVVTLMRAGASNGEIARSLGLAEATIKWYANRIFAALGVNGRRELAPMLGRLSAAEDGNEEG